MPPCLQYPPQGRQRGRHNQVKGLLHRVRYSHFVLLYFLGPLHLGPLHPAVWPPRVSLSLIKPLMLLPSSQRARAWAPLCMPCWRARAQAWVEHGHGESSEVGNVASLGCLPAPGFGRTSYLAVLPHLRYRSVLQVGQASFLVLLKRVYLEMRMRLLFPGLSSASLY